MPSAIDSPTNSGPSGLDGERVVVKDLSARNAELEQELAERRERDDRMRFALAAARIGVWEWDLISDHVTWSSATAAAFGVSPEHVPMSGRAFFELIHPDDRQS